MPGPFCNPAITNAFSQSELIEKVEYVMAFTAAEKVLIAGGVLNLAYGVLLGYPIVVNRVKGAPATPKYLMATHVGALLHAAVTKVMSA